MRRYEMGSLERPSEKLCGYTLLPWHVDVFWGFRDEKGHGLDFKQNAGTVRTVTAIF